MTYSDPDSRINPLKAPAPEETGAPQAQPGAAVPTRAPARAAVPFPLEHAEPGHIEPPPQPAPAPRPAFTPAPAAKPLNPAAAIPATPSRQPVPAAAAVRPARAPRTKRAPYEMKGGDAAAVILLILLDVFGVIASLWGGFRAGFTATYLLFFLMLSIYMRNRGAKISFFAAVNGVLSLGLSAAFLLTSNEYVLFPSFVLLVIQSVIWYGTLAGKPIPPTEAGIFRAFFPPIGHTFRDLPLAMRSLFASKNNKMRFIPKILLGALLSLPVLLIVLPLLIRSDPAFEGLMQRIFSDLFTRLWQLLVALLILPFLLTFVFSLKKEQGRPFTARVFRGFSTPVFVTILSLFSVVYLVYLFSQLAYFFSAFASILPPDFDLTYSAYARRGFFEMSAISVINFVILYLVILLARKNEKGGIHPVLRILGAFIVLVDWVLIGTAFSKMVLYIRYYGLTVSRVSTTVVMAALAVLFLIMLLRLFTPRVRILPAVMILGSLTVLVMGVGNVNSFVARYNYNAYIDKTLPTVDVAYLARIGDEGIPYLVLLANDEDKEISRKAMYWVETSFNEYYDVFSDTGDDVKPSEAKKIDSKISEFNLPRYRVYKAYEQYLEEHPDFADAPYYSYYPTYRYYNDRDPASI